MNELTIRVLIIDDNDQVREGIRTVLGSDSTFQVVAEGIGRDALVLTERWIPDLILMDNPISGVDRIETAKLVKQKPPLAKIVIVTDSKDITQIFEAFKNGAQGYLLNSLQPPFWHEYLKAIAIDNVPMTNELSRLILREFNLLAKPEHKSSSLTHREEEILGLVASGLVNREISYTLGISENTVKNHIKNMMYKLQMVNRVQLTKYAIERGMFMM
ncbi:LuxR C-terminal-related transcriptional regulator [Paenibacillus agaridevorans]|uniref:LuxR C-terminal-related transcriptional regulator n=1 Tax=Paenibacillus agaridevorans TaxID=171404 RepID=UPI001BE4CB75|nr:response regulator transcription factor [Paenibacillus agaridevorans]